MAESVYLSHPPTPAAPEGELGLSFLPKLACEVEQLRISEPQGPAWPGSCGLNGALGPGPMLGVWRHWPRVSGEAASCTATWMA